MAQLGQRLDVEEMGVVAQQVARAVGDRSDDGDRAVARGRNRQDPIVLGEDDRARREVERQPAFALRQLAQVRIRQRLGVGGLEEPEAKLQAQVPSDTR